MRPFVLISSILTLSLYQTSSVTADTTLQINIANLRSANGKVACLLFNSPDGYPEIHEKAYREVHSSIEGEHASCIFKHIPSGTYASITFHDENLNDKLDKNLIGVPQEGYVASNNERPVLSAPRYKEASFNIGTRETTTLKIKMEY